ncbi:MAG: pilus assembly protein PilM, partial [Planctomycetota bacterium]|nr:pilus assembly protein PilM [Planctomycetota bacterium]
MASQAIGVDIGSHAVKVAVLQKKGGISRAVRLFRAPLGGDQDMVRVQGALKRASVTGGPALLGITGRDLIIRYTHVPPVPDWRLKLLMQFEINEVSGQTGDEVAADYRRLELPVEMDEDTVLVALARNTWLSPRLDAARAAGIKAGGGCPNSVALFNAYLAHGSWNEGETTFLVNIGRDNIDMAIQRDGELLFARNMAGGGMMLTEAIMGTFGLKEGKAEKNKITKGDLTPKAMARYPDSTTEKLANAMQGAAGQMVSMIQSSVMICRAQTKISDLNIDKLVLTGGTARMKGIREYFASNMSTKVEIFDPASECDLSQLNPEDQAELGDTPTDFAIAVGLAEGMLSPTAFKLEVLTGKEKKKRHFAERTIWALLAGAAAIALGVMLFKTRASDIEEVRAANEKLDVVFQRNEKVQKRQNTALANENDVRRREVAVRIRRLPGSFMRAITGA